MSGDSREWLRMGAPSKGTGFRLLCRGCGEEVEIAKPLAMRTLKGLADGFGDAHDACGPVEEGAVESS